MTEEDEQKFYRKLMEKHVQDVHDELLRMNLIASDAYEQITARLADQNALKPREIFRLAVQQSTIDTIRTSATSRFDEEHITASFSGSLASNLSWFANAYRNLGGERTLPELRWVHQTKSSEARSGMDFGLLARRPGVGLQKPYRLLLLQAKRANPVDMTIEIDHVTRRRDVSGRLPWSDNAMILLEASAQRHDDHAVDELLQERARAIAFQKYEPKTPRYQLEAVLRTDFRGQVLSTSLRPWCFYVAWYAAKLPQVKDVRSIASIVWANGPDRKPLPIKPCDRAPTFAELLDEALHLQDSDYGLELSIDQVGGTIDSLVEVHPDISFLMASGDENLIKNLRKRSGFTISDSLIPRKLLKVHPQQIFAQRIAREQSIRTSQSKSENSVSHSDNGEDSDLMLHSSEKVDRSVKLK